MPPPSSSWRRRVVWAGLSVLVLAGLLLAYVAFTQFRVPQAASPPLNTPTVPAMEAVQRGAYLARIGNCALCHTAPGGASYAGGKGIATPFGTVTTSNLTPHPEHGLGRWSAEDFWQAMHHGKSRDGRLLNPAFPYTSYTQVTREDSDALWAYLRSLKPSTRTNTPHAMQWPYGTQAALWASRVLGRYHYKALPLDDAMSEKIFDKYFESLDGEKLFFQRIGQLNLSCAQCHDDNHGRRLGGSVIPQGHPTGYPLHRLEWQATDTLSRRIRNSDLVYFFWLLTLSLLTYASLLGIGTSR